MRRRAGFTLIELLLVVFILAAVAASASAIVEGEDLQVRYEQTQERLERVRAAVLGPPGAKTPAGYAADLGRLPASLRDLLDQGAQPAWDPVTGVGWRGPYLRALPRLDGAQEVADGWGNRPLAAEDPANFGWVVLRTTASVADDTLTVRSRGADAQDGSAGASAYDVDYPTTALVLRDDWLVNLKGAAVSVDLFNPLAAGPAMPVTLRLRLLHARDGALVLTTLSQPQTVTVADGATAQVTFVFDPAVDLWAPWGARRFEVVEDVAGSPTFGPGPAQPVELWPRAALPARLATPWSLQ